jgi:PAS domain-containing protein
VEKVIVNFEAVTQRETMTKEEVELNRTRLETILDNIPSALAIVEALEGKTVYMNKGGVQLYGFDSEFTNLRNLYSTVKPKKLDGTAYTNKNYPQQKH